jgi:type IV pilus assembly protein PilQ
VTPHITNNNQILLDLSAERSSLDLAPSDIGLIFNKQIGQTRLLLNDGETAVIGGLTLSEVTRSVTGIPGLMNVPLLGALFRTTKEQETKTDLIILVTPHIVFPDEMRAMQ